MIDIHHDTCPECGGCGRVATVIRTGSGCRHDPDVRCDFCQGRGKARVETIDAYLRGQACAEARRARGESERQAARRLGISLAMLLSMEAGRLDPSALETQDAR